MGEVYRADDLTLGQPVALKFLPDEAARDQALLERFKNEVRIARRVSHPNVCRVYDVGEVEGHTFFTMEYVDGEDLASLLRRIGRLPEDKALDIARQLCAGFAAAHTKGVLHRDLKPANIMLDGRGQVVITDFGLAGIADQIHGADVRSGTPAYMAPEQLAGKEVSTRSDIYSLGLVLYEVFTGKRAFSEKTADKLRSPADRTPSRPSSVVKDLNPVVERVILRCLEAEPSARPATVLSVAAALPGGDPLAAALAAGETPSPQLVAASGETAGLRPRTALACLASLLVTLGIITFLGIHYGGLSRMRLELTPEVLTQKARDIIARLGYTERPADSVSDLQYDSDFQGYVEKNDKPLPDWNRVLAARPSLLGFWYRQSPDDMEAKGFRDQLLNPGIVTQDDPPPTLSGMINVELDPQGRLTYFQAIPPQKDGTGAQSTPFDWNILFAAAGLDPAQFQRAEPIWNSLAASDTRSAWTGTWPGTTRPLRVEAAAWHGKPVFFSLIGDWTKPDRMKSEPSTGKKIQQYIFLALAAGFFFGVIHLARLNYRQGRGDREGAFRLAAVMFALEILLWLCRGHIVAGMDVVGAFFIAVSTALFVSGTTWMLYLALEPWVRRRWPQTIISWSRLLSGQFRDPLVGRDILFGVMLGVVWIFIFQLRQIPHVASRSRARDGPNRLSRGRTRGAGRLVDADSGFDSGHVAVLLPVARFEILAAQGLAGCDRVCCDFRAASGTYLLVCRGGPAYVGGDLCDCRADRLSLRVDPTGLRHLHRQHAGECSVHRRSLRLVYEHLRFSLCSASSRWRAGASTIRSAASQFGGRRSIDRQRLSSSWASS